MRVLPTNVHSPNDYTLTTVDLSDYGFPFLPEVCRISYRFRNTDPSEHVHPGRIELIYLHEGRSLSISTSGRQLSFHPGNCFISRPDEPHCIRTFAKGAKYYWFAFRIPTKRETIPGLNLAETRQLVKVLTNAKPRLFAGSPRLRDAFERILAHAKPDTAPTILPKVRMRTAALNLLLEAAEACGHTPLTPRKTVVNRLADEMSAKPGQDFPLRRIAADAGISVSGLSANFKAATGTTPHAYLLDCRINRAKDLLAADQLTAAEIATSLGFASYTQFSAQFHAHTGVSPAMFRKTAKCAATRHKSVPKSQG